MEVIPDIEEKLIGFKKLDLGCIIIIGLNFVYRLNVFEST